MQSSNTPLPLPSFRVQGFRAFRHLQLSRLGRVNLVVGKNNVGKTTLLEAIRVFSAGKSALHEIKSLLEKRSEFQRGTPTNKQATIIDVQRAFFRAAEPDLPIRNISMASAPPESPPNPNNETHIFLGWMEKLGEDTSTPTNRRLIFDENKLPQSQEHIVEIIGLTAPHKTGIFFELPDFVRPDKIKAEPLNILRDTESENRLNYQYVPAGGLNPEEVGELWDRIALTEYEKDVLKALQIINPEIERVSLVNTAQEFNNKRLALIRRKDSPSPEPLKSMGDGMNRLFELSLSLANAQNGILLVDEIENGIHYSAQESLWQFIFEASHQLGVQVFATTHSWDCIESFQHAASTHSDEGVLISLARAGDEIRTSTFDERELEIITRESIEVR